VHEEAEVLEHVLSEDLEALIAAKLGNPTHDPHGDPIPSADLRMPEEETECLAALEPGATATFVRVSDSDPEMLRYLADLHIAPGDSLTVEDKQPFGGPLFVAINDRTHVLGGKLAGAMRVRL
jgi:DtxR family Mn-dependent transcriptional regulator